MESLRDGVPGQESSPLMKFSVAGLVKAPTLYWSAAPSRETRPSRSAASGVRRILSAPASAALLPCRNRSAAPPPTLVGPTSGLTKIANKIAALRAGVPRNCRIAEQIPAAGWRKRIYAEGAATFFASDESDYVGRHIFNVDRGTGR